jgi:hypothetical protein
MKKFILLLLLLSSLGCEKNTEQTKKETIEEKLARRKQASEKLKMEIEKERDDLINHSK